MATTRTITALVLLAVCAHCPAQAQDAGCVGMDRLEVVAGELWWTWEGAQWGAEGFNGAITADINSQWFSGTTLRCGDIHTVELRFARVFEDEGEFQYVPIDLDSDNVSMAYRYLRAANREPPSASELTSTWEPWYFGPYIVNKEGAGYPYQDRVPICLSAWDVDSEPPRRLEVGFLENNRPGGLVNGAYGPPLHSNADNIVAEGPREWLFIFGLDYTDPAEGSNSEILLGSGLDTEPLPLMWIVFAARAEADRFPQDGDVFRLVPWHQGDNPDPSATLGVSWAAVKRVPRQSGSQPTSGRPE